MEAVAFHSAWAMPVTEGLLLHAFSLEQGDVLSNLHIIALDAIDFGLAVGGKAQIPRWYHWTFKQLMTMFLWGFETRVEPGWRERTTIPTCGPTPPAILARCCSIGAGRSCCASSCCRFSRCGITTRRRSSSPKPPPTSRSRATPTASRACATRSWGWARCSFRSSSAKNEPQQVRLRRRRSHRHVLGDRVRRLRRRGGVRLSLDPARAGDCRRVSARPQALRLGSCCATGSMGRTGSRADSKASARASKRSLPARARCWASFSRWPRLSAIRRSTRTCSPTATPTTASTAPIRWAQSSCSLAGYPAASSSPYMLPWGNDMKQCVQGNMGVWSHYPDASSQQTYAYDYSHDVGTEILASRAGIITQLRDNQPDNDPQQLELRRGDAPPRQPAGRCRRGAGARRRCREFRRRDGDPDGTLSLPYWVPGTTAPLQGLPNPVPLHPSAAIPCRARRRLRPAPSPAPLRTTPASTASTRERRSRSLTRQSIAASPGRPPAPSLLRRHADRSRRRRGGPRGKAGFRRCPEPRSSLQGRRSCSTRATICSRCS